MKKPCGTVVRSVLAAVLSCGAAVQAQAITITTTESQYEPGGVRYHFVVSDWSSGAPGQPSPCNSNDGWVSTCNIMLYAYKRPGASSSVGKYGQWAVPIRRGSSTMGQLQRDLEARGFRIPLSGSILVSHKDANDEACITFSYSHTGPAIGGAIGPFGPCSRVAAPVLSCEIKGDTTIDHKNLPDNALDGAKASTQLNVQCRGPASVTVSASRTNVYGVRLRDDDSLYSKITVNGKDATAGINVPISQGLASPLDITSTLVTRGTVTPGAFSGSTVVTVSPP